MDRNVDRDLQRQLDELQAGFDAMRAAHQAQIVALTEQRLQRLCEWSHVEPQDSFRRGLVSVVGRGLVGAARRLPWPRPQPTATNDSDPQVVEVAGRLINHPPHDSAGAKDGR